MLMKEIHFFQKYYKMSSSDPRLKKLRIQTGVAKRCGKEKLSYRKEANLQKEKLEKMKQEGKDDIQIKNMSEQIQESLMMIPDCHRRLEKAVGEIKVLLQEFESESGSVAEAEQPPEIREAKAALKESEGHLKAE